MPFLTRRRMLTATASSFALLAGCLGSEVHSDGAPEPQSNRQSVDHEYVSVRSATESVLFSSETDQEQTKNSRRERYENDFLATEDDLDQIEFAATEKGDELASFVSETDFDAKSVMLWSSGVTECHEIQLTAVTIGEDDKDPHLDFCRRTRPADISCNEDELHTVAYAVRFPLDGQGVNSYGSGMGSNCHEVPRPPIFDRTVTIRTEGEQ